MSKICYRRSLLDSTLFAVYEDGEVIAHMIYDAWGEPQTETKLDANYAGIDNLNNFTGYTYDETLNLYFAQNRFYDATSHRFTQEDPIKDGENWYAYCGNNPLNFVDPSGLLDIVLRNVAESMGASVKWNNTTKKVTVSYGSHSVSYTADKYDNDRAYQNSNNIMMIDNVKFASDWYAYFFGGEVDAAKWGANSHTNTILKDIGKRWYNEQKTGNPFTSDAGYYYQLACNTRQKALDNTPYVWKQEAIWTLLHNNAQEGDKKLQEYKNLYGGNPNSYTTGVEMAYAWFVTATYNQWNYKENPDWQNPYNQFDYNNDGYKNDLTQIQNSKNWTAYMYFEGKIIAADYLGNLNLGYVGRKMGFAKITLSNFATKDDTKDAEAVEWGMELADQGR